MIEIGQRFIPYKMFNGIHIPNCLLEMKELSSNAKLCWGRLSQYAGENGFCVPKQELLAQELGISLSTVRNALSELKELKFIEIESPQGIDKLFHKNCRYYFLWHEILVPRTIKNNLSEPLNSNSLYNKRIINNKNNIIKEISSKEDIYPSDEGQNHLLINRRKSSLKNTSLIGKKKPKNLTQNNHSEKALRILDYWEKKGLKDSKPDKAIKMWNDSLSFIDKLIKGTMFNQSEYEKYYNYSFSTKEIRTAIDRFALVALHPDYEPKNLGFKQTLSKYYLNKFIFNDRGSENKGYGRSCFINFLENEPKLIKEKDITVEDKYPILTKAIKKKYSQVILGCDNFDFPKMQENDFRKAAIFAQEFFKKNKSRLIGSYQELKPYKIAECLIDALMKSNPDMMRVQPYWLFNNIMQQKLPAYLYSTAIMKEENSSSNSQENTFYNFGQPLE